MYLAFHRRDGKRSELPGASRAVLQHLATSPCSIKRGVRSPRAHEPGHHCSAAPATKRTGH